MLESAQGQQHCQCLHTVHASRQLPLCSKPLQKVFQSRLLCCITASHLIVGLAQASVVEVAWQCILHADAQHQRNDQSSKSSTAMLPAFAVQQHLVPSAQILEDHLDRFEHPPLPCAAQEPQVQPSVVRVCLLVLILDLTTIDDASYAFVNSPAPCSRTQVANPYCCSLPIRGLYFKNLLSNSDTRGEGGEAGIGLLKLIRCTCLGTAVCSQS